MLVIGLSCIRSAAGSLRAFCPRLLPSRLLHQTFPNRCERRVQPESTKDDASPPEPDWVTFFGQWPAAERATFLTDMRVLERFVGEAEEQSLLDEIEPYLKRLRYEFDHWDDAIHGYRETERKHWYPANRAILDRVVSVAFAGSAMPYVHVLDLAEEGVIKPHVDSVRYCGNTIAGISLLSDSVMRLVRTNDEEQTNAEYRQIFSKERHSKYWADILLPRRSLYSDKSKAIEHSECNFFRFSSHTARYKFTHEILPGKESLFRDSLVKRTRRISIICRNDP
uniref:Alpha-ketoglutarate-dependent dioxygenase AlkB-like domain-containing protein n=1 Tax=Anopheles epiroticus TaxID=199890 RepID=A0A182P6V0_9DIPT